MRSVGAVTVGAMVANVAAYLVAIPASRALGAADYGVFGVIMAAMVVVAAPSLAVQAVIAREVVRGQSALVRLGVQTAMLVAVFSLVAGAVLVPLTRVPVAAAAAGMVMAPLITLTAAAQGFLQGRGEFRRLGWLLGLVGVLRSGPMIVALLLGASATVALWVGAIGTLIAAVLAWGLGKQSAQSPPEGDTPSDAHQSRGFGGVWSVLGASQVQLALLVAVSLVALPLLDTSFVVVPLFALANAGVALSAATISAAVQAPVFWGIFVGLVVGKPIGISLATWTGGRSGLAGRDTVGSIVRASPLGGIGFTVALFIATLSFEDPETLSHALVAILSASVTAALISVTSLEIAWKRRLE